METVSNNEEQSITVDEKKSDHGTSDLGETIPVVSLEDVGLTSIPQSPTKPDDGQVNDGPSSTQSVGAVTPPHKKNRLRTFFSKIAHFFGRGHVTREEPSTRDGQSGTREEATKDKTVFDESQQELVGDAQSTVQVSPNAI
jgi:hypothetical protein